MARYERFTFLCDPNERQAIAALAERLSRSQSDAVRFVVVEAAKQLSRTERAEDPKQSEKRVESHAVTA
jgi:hypothetical protein